MRRNLFPLILVVVAMSLIVGCAQAPTEAVEAARARVASVGAEGAVYAADEYGEAQAAVGRMDAEVASQAERFALTRSYDRTIELAGLTETAADEVERAIDAEKQRLRTQATQMVADAESALTDARQALAELPEDEASSLLNDVAGVEASVAAANEALGRDDLSDAYREAEAALQAANRVTASLVAMRTETEETPEPDVLRAVRGGIDIPRMVYLDGEPLAAGAYTLRLADGGVPPVGGETPGSTRWVEFVSDSDGSVAGRGLAAAIPDSEIGEVAKSWVPRNQAYVDELLGGDYVRVWLNRGGVSYLVHATTSAP
ncbi:MAG TPA: hypothetical protein QF572_12920 [Vicinamibacterales bacterium]|jgi:hypothetical protein|nr:hypothetical protein [Vicinamibacterales bacterium]|tara:strand:- start:4333 stop:5280 length:948 start_codon:yes stop_codon:yes gene_type:complete